MKTILITGAAGFLGSHLCDRFISEGFSGIAMDNFITGDQKNIKHLFGHSNFTFVEHDVTEFLNVQGHLSERSEESHYHAEPSEASLVIRKVTVLF